MSHIYSFDEQKKIFIDKAVVAIFFFAFPTALLSFYRSISIGWQPQMYLHVALCIIYTVLFWKRKTLSYLTITVAIVSSCFAISFSSFLFMGLTGAGELFLVVGLTLAAIFLEKRMVVAYSALSIATLIATAFLHVYGVITIRFNVDAYQQEWGSWMLSVVSLCMACFVSIIVMQSLMGSLRENMANISEKNEQLALALHDLQRAAEEKRQLLSTVSHELRTPINGVMGMARMLAETDLDPAQHKQAEQLLRASVDLTKTVNDSTYYTQLSEGTLELASVPFDLPKTLGDACDLYAHVAREKGLRVECSCGVEQHRFIGDPSRLHAILSNLMDNAVKFSDSGTIRLSLSIIEGSQWLRIVVEDEGIGIDAQYVDRIFEPFFQIDRGMDRQYDGMGLGLSVCKSLVEAMGGTLSVESTPGERTAFIVQLSLPHASDLASDEDTPTVEQASLPTKALNVLVVEDNRLNAVIAERHITQLGHVVRCAYDGAEAVHIVEEEWPDIVFMDIHMPIMNGMEATQKIRQLPAMQSLPIIALTADAFEEQHRRFVEAGVDAVLIKPYKKSQIEAAIIEHMR